MSYNDEVNAMIDSILDECGSTEDGEPNSLPNDPEQSPETQYKQLEDDLGGGEYEEVGEVEADVVEMASEMVDRTVLEQDSAYQTYFRSVMKKHGVSGIKHMNNEKKREFFKDVSNGWKKHKKVKEGLNRGSTIGRGVTTKMVNSTLPKTYGRVRKVPGYVQNRRKIRHGKADRREMDGGGPSHGYSEQKVYEQYKKYFKHMLDECGIEDFNALSEVEQAEFMGLVNEAFQTTNELMQKPGAPMGNPMNTFDNTIDSLKNRVRPERRIRQMAAAKQAVARPKMREGMVRDLTRQLSHDVSDRYNRGEPLTKLVKKRDFNIKKRVGDVKRKRELSAWHDRVSSKSKGYLRDY